MHIGIILLSWLIIVIVSIALLSASGILKVQVDIEIDKKDDEEDEHEPSNDANTPKSNDA